MAAIPNGSTVTYVGTVIPGVGLNSADAQARISAALGTLGMTVRTASQTGESFFSIGTEPVTFTMQIEVDTGFDYASENDVASIINHGIYTALGSLPSSYSIPRFVLPPSSGGGSQETGQPTPDPGKTAPKTGCISGTSHDLSDSFSISCWFSNLTTKGLSTVGLLAIAIAVGIAVFVFSPRPRVTVG